MTRKIFAMFFVFAALALLASACETIPDDKGANVKVTLDVLPTPAAADAGISPQVAVGTQYHVKITLTNPDETFYAFGWTPPEPISLMVAASGQRVIDVEVYEVNSGVSTNFFPASHYITFTSPAQRTLDLSSSEPQTVNLIVGYDSNSGDIGGGSEVLISDGNTYGPLEFYRSCPPPSQFYADIVDLDWGGFKMFPTIPVDLAGGSYPTLKVYSLPAGHNFGLDVFHSTAGVWDRVSTLIVTGTNPVNVKLGGYFDPRVAFMPEKPTVSYGGSFQASVPWHIVGGWGGLGINSSPLTTINDTCLGADSSVFDPYSFYPPGGRQQCNIEFNAEDCRGTPVLGAATVQIKPTCGNFICEDWLGENNNCNTDCYCGDGYCYPGFENMTNCQVDCAAK